MFGPGPMTIGARVERVAYPARGETMFTGTIIFCIFIAICIIVGALIIQLSTNMAAGFKPSL